MQRMRKEKYALETKRNIHTAILGLRASQLDYERYEQESEVSTNYRWMLSWVKRTKVSYCSESFVLSTSSYEARRRSSCSFNRR